MIELTIDEVSRGDDDPFAALGGILKAYNASHGAPFDWQPLWLFARDADGKVQAGLRGHTAWRWAFVDTLAVAEAARRTGIGSRLLARAETVARSRDCIGLYLWTTSFQAPEFYRRHGYQPFGSLPDLPVGHTATWFMKRF